MPEKDRDMNKQNEDALEEQEFEAAIEHFSKAMELENEDTSWITGRAEVYLKMGKYNECIADCIKVEERGQKSNVNVERRAKALRLKALAYLELAKCAKDYDLAIEALEMACKVHDNQETLHELEYARSAKEEIEKRELRLGYLKRELGNKVCKENRIKAVKHYTEAIKLNPRDVEAYSNRAFCYISDGRLSEGLKDAEKCLELDPTFVGGYLRKGNIEFEKKEYRKALETYEMGLKHDTENKELLDAIRKCHEQMPPAADHKDTVIESHEAMNDKEANAMLNPEIQTILADPIMRQVLIDFQENSSDAQEHAKNKLVLEELQKLLDAGLL